MNFFAKRRFVFWTLIVLIVITVSALVSFFLFSKQNPANVACCPQGEKSGCDFTSELRLTPDQTGKVTQINNEYRQLAEPIVAAIREKREIILSELDRDKPDTGFLNQVVKTLSLLQMEIQQKNILQYLQLKKVCTPEQAHRLSALYRDLYGCPMQGNRMQYRHSRGMNMRDSACQN
ncbi:MAG: periplasmic heavy metal sensor [Bacteroidota bacterium]